MSIEIDGSVAIVTGAATGLGRALTLELASRGAQIVLAGRRPAPLATLADEVVAAGGAAVATPVDVTRPEDRTELVGQTLRSFGRVDILVNNAAIARAAPFAEENPAPVIETNLVGPIALTREVLPGMMERRSGRILNVASLANAGLPFVVDYSASKAGLVAFSTALREELHGTGVVITVVSPGFMVDAGMYVPYETPVPWYLGSNLTTTVARKAIRAMAKGRSSVILNRMPVRPLLLVQAFSDKAFRSITRTLGLRQYLELLAERRVDYNGQPLPASKEAALWP